MTPEQRRRRAMAFMSYAAAFASSKSLEMVVNGSFDADTAWTKGTGWVISGGTASRPAQGAASTITQPCNLIAGQTYRVTFTITAISAGTIIFRFINGTTVSGTGRTTPGTYTQDLVALNGNDTIGINANTALTDATIDNVSVVRVLP